MRARVLERLGLPEEVAPDFEGLRAVYGAWCAKVPFDNVQKMIALRASSSAHLAGGDAREFFENWLAHGTGGTCWPSSNALFELLAWLGFEACRIAGCMLDLGLLNHASVKVTIDGHDWLVDSSLLSNEPLPLGSGVFRQNDPVFPVEVEFEEPTHVVWSHTPPNSGFLPCRIRHERMSHAEYLALYEGTRAGSPFNQRLYARRNRPGEMVVLLGNTRFSKTVQGVESRTLSPEGVCKALHDDIGLSETIVEAWVRSGSLADSFQPPAGPKPPPVTRKPPSQR